MYKTQTIEKVDHLLEVSELSVFYGKLQAVNNVSFQIPKGKVFAIVGANGAGKTSLLRGIYGTSQYTGSLKFNNVAFTAKTNRFKSGIAHVPQGRAIFGDLTVKENLSIGVLGIKKKTNELEYLLNLFPILETRMNKQAGMLSGGEQQMLAIARAMMSRPSLLLLDEPGMGLSPKLRMEVYESIRRLLDQADHDMGILLCDQEIGYALRIADQMSVMQKGQFIWTGEANSVSVDELSTKYMGLKA
ncbi:ABC transporter ATP-binding protein [Neobacillus sp. GCM10023253]|uniref:ABC transporter ATP-binding protein n=1 Tax=Neobacillus sp. GCM10023253 TaxID=3252644 RepID=UPI003615AE99